MNQLEYIPGMGGQKSIPMDGPSAFVGTADGLRSRKWQYDLGYRGLFNATRPAREVDVDFVSDYETADALRRVADADVAARTPGTFLAQGEWRQNAYIVESEPTNIHYGWLSTTLKALLLDGAWWRVVKKSFRPENTVIDKQYITKTGTVVYASGASDAPLNSLKIYGKSKQATKPKDGVSVPIDVVGAQNLIPYDIDTIKTYNTSGSWNGNVYTYRTIQTTFNEDGTITLNGTASGTYTLYLVPNSNQLFLPDGNYTLTGELPGTGSDSTWYFQATTTTDSSGTVKARNRDYGSGVTFAVDSTVYGVSAYFHAATGDTFNNAVLKPQLVAGSQAQPFVPYGCIGLKVDDTITPIDLQGNVLVNLPDGTQDVLNVNSTGDVTLTKRVGVVNLSTLTWGIPGGVQQPAVYYRSNAQSTLRANSSIPGILAEKFVQAKLQDVTNVASSNTYVISSDSLGTNYAQLYAKMSGGNSADRPTGLCYFPLKTPQEISLDSITMPTVENYDQIRVLAPPLDVEITAKYEISPSVFLDYPHDYEYDFLARSAAAQIETSVLTPCDVQLIIYGQCDNPSITIGDNRYQVNCGVPAGAYLTIDGREKTIILTLEDGTAFSVFSDGVRGSGLGGGEYVFEPIQPGTQQVEWDGSFGFDLGWYEEEGEPPWSQS